MLIAPEYAQRLAKLLHEGKLILFAGAGLSLQARSKISSSERFPLWFELAKRVADQTGERLDDYGGDFLDLFDSIVRKFNRVTLEDAIRAAIPEDNFQPGAVHEHIANLPWRRVYTTNYDTLIDQALGEKQPIVSERDFELLTREANKQPKIIHLHGTLLNMHTVTGEDYQRWPERHPKAYSRLVQDGSEATMLFMGFSNSDPHFRHVILPLIKKLKTDRGHYNHSWMWNPSKDQILLYQQRDRVDVHPIEYEQEWEICVKILEEAFLDVQRGKFSRRAIVDKELRLRRVGPPTTRLNGYKLFYYRDIKSIKRVTLSAKTNIDVERVAKLETVDMKRELSADCFQLCSELDFGQSGARVGAG